MSGKIPVFDDLGNQVGTFESTTFGQGALILIGAVVLGIMYVLPCISAIAPPVAFLWALALPKKNKHKKIALWITGILLALWVISNVLMGSILLLDYYLKNS